MTARSGHESGTKKKDFSETQKRKQDHLRLCLDPAMVSGFSTTGLEAYSFIHNALPELNLDDIDLSRTFLGKKLRAPLLISSMTGGFDLASKVNCNLAEAAERTGVAMGVGSQRVALEKPEVAFSFQVRSVAPDILLLANLGAVQLNYGYGAKECQKAVEMIDADGLVLHLNVLQELIQPEGNRNFRGLAAKIAEVCDALSVPVVGKEIGYGISDDAALRLRAAGVKAIDVAGKGGTSWFAVEKARSKKLGVEVKDTFANWGIPTDQALLMVKRAVPELELVASGGIRTGLEVAKVLALGATVAGIGQPLLEPALESADRVVDALERIILELRVTMLCIGASSVSGIEKERLVRYPLI
jgi:isopentenyl-diphosphate delta-isomerase